MTHNHPTSLSLAIRASYSDCIAKNYWGSARASLTAEVSWVIERLCLEEAIVGEVVEVKKIFWLVDVF